MEGNRIPRVWKIKTPKASKSLMTVTPSTGVVEAVRSLRECKRFGGLPVVEDCQLVGVITR